MLPPPNLLPHQYLKTYFGYDQFRPGQLPAIEAVLASHDTLLILPTGGGKSICFQIPALVLGKTTIVVSPLISLMKDQVENLEKKQISAVCLHSHLSPKNKKAAEEKIAKGDYRFIYVSPEKLQQPSFIKLCQQIEVSLLVIDEAHCIDQWGFDFRPVYNTIPIFIQSLKKRPSIMAVTATATPDTEITIQESLKMKNIKTFRGDFFRPNLFISVIKCQNKNHKEWYLSYLLQKFQNQSSIIFTATRKSSEYVHQLLQHFRSSRENFKSDYYHAGRSKLERSQVQNDFITDDLQIISATNAFGMGIDKASIRCVIHFQLPSSLEAYYQEIGRAGRDGKISHCFLLYDPKDEKIPLHFIQRSKASETQQQKNQNKFKAFKRFLNSKKCRHKLLTDYFGSPSVINSPCGVCDNCQPLSITPNSKQNVSRQKLYKFANTFNQKGIRLSDQLINWIALYQPQTPSDYLEIPGIGNGWVNKWYNTISEKT